MLKVLLLLVGALVSACRDRADLVVEILALRQQLAAFALSNRRPRVTNADRWFWVVLRRRWAQWSDVLIFVKPETVIRWHRAGFRRYWTWRSRRHRRPGRPPTDRSIRDLVRRMATENPTWGAPRIHGELRMLGIAVSERTVSRYMPRRPSQPDTVQRWCTFLHNHRDAIAAMDFFVVPTVTFRRALPRGSGRLHAERCHRRDDGRGEDRVAVEDQVPWRGTKRERLAQLLDDPRGRWIGGHVEVQDASAIVADHEPDVDQ